MVNQFGQAQMAGPAWLAGSAPALATRRWSSKAIWMRSGWSSASIFWVLLARDGFLFQKPLSQMHGSTFLPLQHTATLIFSVDWG